MDRVNDRINRTDAAAKQERLLPPQMIQKTHAVRHQAAGESGTLARIVRTLQREAPGVEARKMYKIEFLGDEATGLWAAGTDYVAGDKSKKKNSDGDWEVKECIKNHTSNVDDRNFDNTTYWKDIEGGLDAGVLHFDGDLTLTSPWFQVDDIVLVKQVGTFSTSGVESEEKTWKILATVSQVETIDSGGKRHYSIRWYQSTGYSRTKAVFGA